MDRATQRRLAGAQSLRSAAKVQLPCDSQEGANLTHVEFWQAQRDCRELVHIVTIKCINGDIISINSCYLQIIFTTSALQCEFDPDRNRA
jgi:hypothetical protein